MTGGHSSKSDSSQVVLRSINGGRLGHRGAHGVKLGSGESRSPKTSARWLGNAHAGGSEVGAERPPTKRCVGRAAPAGEQGHSFGVGGAELAHACNICSSRLQWLAARV